MFSWLEEAIEPRRGGDGYPPGHKEEMTQALAAWLVSVEAVNQTE